MKKNSMKEALNQRKGHNFDIAVIIGAPKDDDDPDKKDSDLAPDSASKPGSKENMPAPKVSVEQAEKDDMTEEGKEKMAIAQSLPSSGLASKVKAMLAIKNKKA